jgi:hypothetical protein
LARIFESASDESDEFFGEVVPAEELLVGTVALTPFDVMT